MDYKISKLSNGLKILTVPMPGLESVTISVWVKTGSRFEEKRINGLSHFLEHIVFKGSQKRPTAREISEAVDGIGGEFNAGTSKDWTNFYIKSRAGHAETAMDVLSDMVFRPVLDPEEIEREKGTIIQELAMYDDTPVMKIQDVFEGLAFEGNPLGWDVGGDKESVSRIKKEDFEKYRSEYYHPDTMLVSISGGIKEGEALELAERYFGKLGGQKTTPRPLQKFKTAQKNPKLQIKNKKVEQAHLILGFLSEGRGYEGRFIQSVLSTILAGPMSSRLFIEIRERRGLAYAVKPTADRFEEVGYFGVYAGVSIDKAPEAVRVMLDQIYGLANGTYPVTPAELTKTKEYIKGHVALSLEDTLAAGSFFAEQAMFLKKVLTPEEIYKKIDDVTREDVVKEAKKIFVKDRLNLAIIGPYKDGKKFVKFLK